MDDNRVVDSGLNFNKDLVITEVAKGFLEETVKWAKFLALVGFVIIGIIVIAGIFAGSIMALTSGANESIEGDSFFNTTVDFVSGTFMTIFYLAFGLLYLMPTLYLYRFATNTKNALRDSSSELLTGGLENLKSCFKFIGILMIVMLCFYAIILATMLFTLANI